MKMRNRKNCFNFKNNIEKIINTVLSSSIVKNFQNIKIFVNTLLIINVILISSFLMASDLSSEDYSTHNTEAVDNLTNNNIQRNLACFKR